MKSSLRKVVMSKKVATAYLDKVSKTASTLTVYFQDESGLKGFMRQAQEDFGSKVSCSRGFDYLTFMSMDGVAIDSLRNRVQRKGLDFSD